MTDDDTISVVSPASTCAASFAAPATTATKTWDKTTVPFARQLQLCDDLNYTLLPEKVAQQLRSHTSHQTLPDAPRIGLDSRSGILEYCLEDLDTPRLNNFGEKLWWASPTPDVVSLSQHTVLDRRLQITEDPSVHLLWVEGILFLKPLPAYLTSHAFWEFLLDKSSDDTNRDELHATCLGFLKTYASLIQRRSDFRLAQKHHLLGGLEDVTFESFIAFISSFDNIPHQDISSRWRYGLIHLDALNFHSALHLHRWHLNRFELRWATYFSRFFPVVLFIFAVFSVMLSAMQVIIAAKEVSDTATATANVGFKKVLNIFIWFGTEAIGWSIGFGLFIVVWWLAIMFNEVWHRRRMQHRVKKRLRSDAETT
ncbi:hypothetical protein DE146DRAFT_198459 [Phaeosphaeria sp. MPI-PUGE-AT-0046c]|nr:hypothetical protein DE146DRAFT_198459 [Phaeosphaeria sp. MPI-PUGE-AT-0046c]